MKRILTADLHIHSHFNNPIFINIGVDYLEYLMNYCLKNSIKTIDILGDIFHISSKINIEIFIPIFEMFEKIHKKGIIVNIIPGNHEIVGNNFKTILETLKPFCNIYSDYTIIKEDDILYHYLPFSRNIDFTQLMPDESKTNILFSHFNVGGFKLNENILSKGITINDIIKKSFKYIFLGDLHIHQNQGNIIYTGSPYQQNFGEVGQIKGFIELDNDWKFIIYDNYPKFKILTAEESLKEEVSNSFIKLKINNKIDNLSKLREILYDRGSISIEQEFQSNSKESSIIRTEITRNSDLGDLIKEYINNSNISLDKSKLIKIFEKISL